MDLYSGYINKLIDELAAFPALAANLRSALPST